MVSKPHKLLISFIIFFIKALSLLFPLKLIWNALLWCWKDVNFILIWNPTWQNFDLYFIVQTKSIIYKNIVYSMQKCMHIFMFYKIIVRSEIMYRSEISADSELKFGKGKFS